MIKDITMLTAYFKIFKDSDKVPDIGLDFSDYRKNKILLCKNSHDKLLEYGAALTLKKGLYELGFDERITRYAIKDNGKPYFPDIPSLHFSISHAKNMAITVFSDKNVGIDCEHSKRILPDKILSRFFSRDEAEAYRKSPLKLWVIKESLSKLSGNGILGEIKKNAIPFFDETMFIGGIQLKIYTLKDYLICVSSEEHGECRFISV